MTDTPRTSSSFPLGVSRLAEFTATQLPDPVRHDKEYMTLLRGALPPVMVQAAGGAWGAVGQGIGMIDLYTMPAVMDGAGGGDILFVTDSTARTVTFTPPTAPTRYRFVNLSPYLLPGAPISIVSTLGTETGASRVVVHDTLDCVYYPGIGFYALPGQLNFASRNYSAIAAGAASVGGANEIVHSFLIPKGSLRVGDRVRLRMALARSASAETWTWSFRLHTSVAVAGTTIGGGVSLGTGNLMHAVSKTWRVDTATSLQSIGTLYQLAEQGQQSGAMAAFTIPDLAATDLYGLVILNRSGTSETCTIQQCDMEVLR